MRYFSFICCCLLLSCSAVAQKKTKAPVPPAKPKLVVGIIVDQMRDDFLYRYYDRYREGGLKRLMNKGFNCKNNHYHYATTVTGPGHAHVWSGSTPAISGIIGNEWYDRQLNGSMYVAADSTVQLVGDGSPEAGKMSPKNMLVSTITDQLMLSNEFQSKVVGIAFKDRGAIMPVGHTGKAYWFDSKKGNWISSTFYGDKLPTWIDTFNARQLPKAYVANEWTTLYPLETYTQSEPDDQPYENTYGTAKAVFPHKVAVGSLALSPYGNEITREFAEAAIAGEGLGKDAITDVLALSFSTPDYVGHAYGPHSVEVEDIYLRLDLELEKFFNYLDKNVGEGQYLVFLTADHGVADVPSYLKKHKIPAGLLTPSEIKKAANAAISAQYGVGSWIKEIDNYQIYFDRDLLLKNKLTPAQLLPATRQALLTMEGIYDVIDLQQISTTTMPQVYRERVINMYHPKRSGDLMFFPEPAWFAGYTKGTTHGTMWPYDTHVPLLWYGWKIEQGETVEPTQICDIAPTLAVLLGLMEPNGSIGKPIEELFD